MRLATVEIDGVSRLGCHRDGDKIGALRQASSRARTRCSSSVPTRAPGLAHSQRSSRLPTGARSTRCGLLAPVSNPSQGGRDRAQLRRPRHRGRPGAPAAPMVFAKFPSRWWATGTLWRGTRRWPTQVDYEAELGIVIGRRRGECPRRTPWTTSLATPVINDVSARDLQSATASGCAASRSTRSARGPWSSRPTRPGPAALPMGTSTATR